MPAPLHATLTEDEDVLLAALEPRPGDRVIALFAEGNGDAGLALLANAPDVVHLADWFAGPSLAAQVELKTAALAAWKPAVFRQWLGLVPGMEPGARERLFTELARKLSEPTRRFWMERRAAIAPGLVHSDQTRKFGRFLANWRPVLAALSRWPGVERRVFGLALSFSGLPFPDTERRNSLGFRQLSEDPKAVLVGLFERIRIAPDGDFVNPERFNYLSEGTLARLAGLTARLKLAPKDRLPEGVNRIYLSNLIDHLSAD